MITFDEAVKKANEYLSNTDIPVVITSQGRFSEGWFFCFQSKEYLDTGETSALLAGNAPFIIDKDTGELHVFGTAHPLKEYLQDYEEKKNNSNQ
ncbi:YrhB domain-containing protein [Pantoea ananatis]|uniref:YrhB domain-containing protein n=1 Tax=Pantoea ananas TaxID=553 RepID=UPI001B304ADA|nr:YrhB domain-containing protein [Pantoea ananatis]